MLVGWVVQSRHCWVRQGSAWQPYRTPSYTPLLLASWGRTKWKFPPIIELQSCKWVPITTAFQSMALAFCRFRSNACLLLLSLSSCCEPCCLALCDCCLCYLGGGGKLVGKLFSTVIAAVCLSSYDSGLVPFPFCLSGILYGVSVHPVGHSNRETKPSTQ